MSRNRLTKEDWKLIGEALDMLLTDYSYQGEGQRGHPHEARLIELSDLACQLGYRKSKVKQRQATRAAKHSGDEHDQS